MLLPELLGSKVVGASRLHRLGIRLIRLQQRFHGAKYAVCLAVLFVTSCVQAQSVTATLNAGPDPDLLGLNPVTNKLYVASAVTSTVTVIDATTNTATTINLVGGGGAGG